MVGIAFKHETMLYFIKVCLKKKAMQEEVDGLKNKIKKFSKGDFQLAQPQVVFPDTSLILTIGEGEVYKGYFMIKNRGEGSIRGLVYSSSFRMRCLEQGFEGNPVRVEFEYAEDCCRDMWSREHLPLCVPEENIRFRLQH